MEVVEKDKLLSTYVFYRCESGVEIPMYRDWGKNWSEEEVYRTIRNMMFVLSFLPDHPVLSTIRDKITLLS